MKPHCECDECKDGMIHDSDCAVHNQPALPKGECNCLPTGFYITCQFCGEIGFDYVGLKMHYENGWCDAYSNTSESIQEKQTK